MHRLPAGSAPGVRAGAEVSRSAALDTALLLVLSACLAARLFCGFGLGDDTAYDDLASRILRDGYPAARDLLVFAGRPVLLYLIAASYGGFGYTEFAFVLPAMLASMTCVLAVYACARLFGGRRAGLLAAATLLVSTLHASHATTMTNDIVGAAFLAVGGTLGLVAPRLSPAWSTPAAATAGFVAALAWGVKPSFVLVSLPVFATLGYRLAIERHALAAALTGGAAAAGVAFLAFFWLTAGDPFAGLRVELTFNRTHMVPDAAERSLSEMLRFYPRIAAGVAWAGPPPYQWLPAGLFFPIAAAASAVALLTRRAAPLAFAGLTWTIFALLEFWPLQVSPYVPIHRLPRFLYPTLVPGAIAVGLVGARLAGRSRAAAALVAAAFAVYAWSSLGHAARAATLHQDAMADVRFAAGVALHAAGPVIADDELIGYVQFAARNGGRQPAMLRISDLTSAPVGAIAIVGGSRRPELSPDYTISAAPPAIPDAWVPVLSLPGQVAPWRPWTGTVYLVQDAVELREDERGILGAACPSTRDWAMRDLIDIGSANSEADHAYRVEGVTWRGAQVLRAGGGDAWDRGVAFTGSLAFTARGLVPGADVCVAKRIDPRVGGQVSWLRAENAAPVEMRPLPANDGHWGVAVALVPGAAVRDATVGMVEQFVRSSHDVNAFRIEIYQPEPAERPARQ